MHRLHFFAASPWARWKWGKRTARPDVSHEKTQTRRVRAHIESKTHLTGWKRNWHSSSWFQVQWFIHDLPLVWNHFTFTWRLYSQCYKLYCWEILVFLFTKFLLKKKKCFYLPQVYFQKKLIELGQRYMCLWEGLRVACHTLISSRSAHNPSTSNLQGDSTRACVLSCVQLFVTPLTIARQAPLSMGFPRQEH